MKHFKETEFLMGGTPVFDKMDPAFLLKLDELRDKANVVFKITSSYRSEEYNRKIGGAKASYHLKGRAIDMVCIGGTTRAAVIKEALNLGLSVGIGSTFLHIDNRPEQVVFHYYNK